MTDINITFTECCLGAETIHTCNTLSEAIRWAISLLESDKAVPVRIMCNDTILWNCVVDDEDKLQILLDKLCGDGLITPC